MGVFDVVNFIRAQVVNFWLAPKVIIRASASTSSSSQNVTRHRIINFRLGRKRREANLLTCSGIVDRHPLTDPPQNRAPSSESLVDYGAVSTLRSTRFHRTPFQTVRAVFPHTAYR
jgi:hypothetical protein